MKDKRFWAGMGLTGLWILFFSYMVLCNERPIKLNEWGDVFAGFFSPVAFLWLVLGYMQQGEELRNSTATLKLQADELKNSVEQQTQLVEVSRQQMRQEMEVVREERELRHEAARPRFVFRHGGTSGGPSGLTYSVQIINIGNTATNLLLAFDPPIGNFSRQGFDLLDRNQTWSIGIATQAHFSTLGSLTYTDASGISGEVRICIVGDSGGQLSLGPVERIA